MRFAQFFKQYFSRFLVSLGVFLSSCPPVFAGDGGSLRAFWDHVCGLALIGAVIVTSLFYIAEYKFLDTFFPTRYKITATVEVNGKLYEGSAVQQYYCYKTAKWIQMLYSGECLLTHAEAVVVDLKERGYLFFLISGRHLTDHSGFIIPILFARGQNPFQKAPTNLPKKWQLTDEQIPFMVIFDDLKNPKTVKEVDPKNLAASLGTGVRLRSIEVEEVTETVTCGNLWKLLPWLKNLKDELKITTKDGPTRLSKVDFLWGVN